MSKIDIVGKYRLDGNRFTSPEKPFYLVLDKRKQSVSGKPPTFLLAKTTAGTFENGREAQYVSSVYPVYGKNYYRIEFQSVQYVVHKTADGLVISDWLQMA